MRVVDGLAGLLIGCVLGGINMLVLRAGVRLAVTRTRAQSIGIIVGSYVIRYALIALVIYGIIRMGNVMMAVATLAVLGLLTILLATIQRGRMGQ